MSFRKKDHLLPNEKLALLEQKLVEKIADALREKFKNSPTAVKSIANETGGAVATVKKWYNGKNAPSLGHFLILCRHYDEILAEFLNLSGNGYLADFISSKNGAAPLSNGHDRSNLPMPGDPENVSINVTIKSLNERQNWFLERVRHRIAPTIDEFVGRWSTTERTARRDIAKLLSLTLIRRVGSKKNGRYEPIP